MNFSQFTRIIGSKLKWLILFPSIIAVLVYFLTSKLPKEFVSGASVYTGIASGVNSSNSDDNGQSNFDYNAVNNAFDNLMVTIHSRQTSEEVAVKLLAKHLMLKEPELSTLSQEGFDLLALQIPQDERNSLIGKNEAETTEKILKELHSSGDNFIAELINSNKGFYSIETINSNLTVKRKQSSDFIDISFKSSDPGVAVWTVRLLSETFISKFKYLKGSETINVVKWFETRLQEAAADLNNSEDKLKDFGVKNKIINYQEQTKFLAEEKELNESNYYKELSNNEASKRAIARLEDKLENRDVLLKNNEELNRLRKKLGDANEQLERAKIYGNPVASIDILSNKVNALKKEIQLYVLQYYSLNHTIESVPQENILNKWLNETLISDESEARLKVHIDRRKEFDRQYVEFSPLGMQMSRLEREIDVAEKQYLEILHGLHLAKLRQQNIEMSNNLQVTDAPSFPTKPIQSRRLPLIIISFLASFFLLLVYFIARDLLDSTIKNGERAEELTGLKLFSALPITSNDDLANAKLENTLLDFAVTNLKIELENSNESISNYLITVISNREQEGKTYASNKLAEKLYSLDYSVLFLTNDERVDDIETEDRRFRAIRYDVTSKLFSARSEQNLLPEFSRVNKEAYNFIILEVPAISVNAIPNQLIKNSKLSLLMLDSRRSWATSDNYMLNLFQKATNNSNKIMVWLNYVTPKNLTGLVGVPHHKSVRNGRNSLVKS
jgi:succinoglycan biosynthesis transport protein ExoP